MSPRRGGSHPRTFVRLLLCSLLWACLSRAVLAFRARIGPGTMQISGRVGLVHAGLARAQPTRLMQLRLAARAAGVVGSGVAARKRVLVVVESPTKAGTIGKYLADQPAKYVVQSTMGHLRDLLTPRKIGDIAAEKLSPSVRTYGVDIEHNFEPVFANLPEKASTIAKLKSAAREADEVILATDGDREGEAISWHVKELLDLKVPYSRAVFHEVTKDAIVQAFNSSADINMKLVEAQIGRRMLDRLTGFSLSRVFMQLCLGKSAGRVQSAALAVICDREDARLRFVPSQYFSITANLTVPNRKTPFPAKLVQIGDRHIAGPGDADKKATNYVITNPEAAQRIHAWLSSPQTNLQVRSLKQQEVKRKPPPPLITSTLQQEASKRLGMSPSRTMTLAAQLYEEGYITYHRTDDPVLSSVAESVARKIVVDKLGEEYLGHGAMRANKPKNSQEAHEAIRPVIVKNTFVHPDKLDLSPDLRRLYSLVYERTVASVMADATILQTSCDIEATNTQGQPCVVDDQLRADVLILRATGSVVKFEGFRQLAKSHKKREADGDDSSHEDAEGFGSARLPELKDGMRLKFHAPKAGGPPDVQLNEHATKPPGRFTESAFIKELESVGIGRPSTYAAILDKLKEREYIHVHARSIRPTIPGMAATAFLRKYYAEIVDTHFTANMEDTLDEIAQGNADRVSFMHDFYFGDNGLAAKVGTMQHLTQQNARGPVDLPALQDSRYAVFVGPHKPFARDMATNKTVTLPDALIQDPEAVTVDTIRKLFEKHAGHVGTNDSGLGVHPTTGLPMSLRSGSYGPFIMHGAPGSGEPTFHNVPDSYVERMTPELAVAICNLPRIVGDHPAVGAPITLGMDREGMFVRVGIAPTKYYFPSDVTSPADVTLEDALSVLPDDTTVQQLQPTKLGDHQKKPVYAGLHKRVAYVIHGAAAPVYLPQNSIDGLTLEQAIKHLRKPPKFRSFRSSSRAKGSRKT